MGTLSHLDELEAEAIYIMREVGRFHWALILLLLAQQPLLSDQNML